MKLPRDIMFYVLFGTILLLIALAAESLYSTHQTLELSQKQLYKTATNTSNIPSRMVVIK